MFSQFNVIVVVISLHLTCPSRGSWRSVLFCLAVQFGTLAWMRTNSSVSCLISLAQDAPRFFPASTCWFLCCLITENTFWELLPRKPRRWLVQHYRQEDINRRSRGVKPTAWKLWLQLTMVSRSEAGNWPRLSVTTMRISSNIWTDNDLTFGCRVLRSCEQRQYCSEKPGLHLLRKVRFCWTFLLISWVFNATGKHRQSTDVCEANSRTDFFSWEWRAPSERS